MWARGGSAQPAVSARGPRRGDRGVTGIQEGCFTEGGWCLVVTVPFLQAPLLGLTRSRGAATYAQTLHNIPETQVTTLDNGLRVASEESSQPTCTVRLGKGKALLETIILT